jgi:chromosome segregation ATPase
MATTNADNLISSKIPNSEMEQAIKSVTELLEKLKEDKPTSQQDLMNLIENVKSIRKPTKEAAVELFEAIETKFPHKTLGEDKWYLVVVSVR